MAVEWSHDHKAFIREHFNIDMTADELGRHFEVGTHEIYAEAERLGLRRGGVWRGQLTAIFSGFPCAIAPGVCASIKDAYDPLPPAEWQKWLRENPERPGPTRG